ncbi:ArsR/SmtB family transcription factor [Spirosoma sordidisoli]|uniref:ArsR family transcriptional regulator n=1 Tax=Spirosoma sordidisoli TaxID=2502893 RepID=A0A4Q2UDD3_9BACT|nr:metalloregulator ArsR/SmtB family transcription factor [Spirosoma sordidisoli]RYC66212.1 ArsR family transcriptional regulator [Spirosoma sordidisoli]
MEENTDCIRVYADKTQIEQCIEKIQQVEPSVTRLAQVMNLAGSEPRLKILYLLEQESGLCVCDLSDILRMTIPAVSQHLRKLKDAQLIQPRKVGQTVFYSLQQEASMILHPVFSQIATSKLEMV